MKKLIIILLLLPVLLTSCKKDKTITPTPPVQDTSALVARDALYGLMQEWYLWYNHMPVITLDNYTNPYDLLEALRYKPIDRWSFVADYDAYVAAMVTGSFIGHGIRLGLDASDKVRIVMIYNNSPLYAKGVRRGWIIKELNGTDLAQVILAGDYETYTQLFGPAQEGVTNTFLFQTPEGKDSTIISTKAQFTLNSVIVADTLHLKSGITGHLVFDQFIIPSSDELKSAFNYFATNNVTDLILDMRYNGGGYESILQELVSYIAGSNYVGSPFIKITYNDKHTEENRTVEYISVTSPLGLNRLVVITTRSTASASEEVINGLKASIPVICFGDTTNGKPTGMNLWTDNDQNYVFAPVTFEAVNANNVGGFYNGIPPDKYVPDDFTHDFSDHSELCLNEAIHYLETGSISRKSAYIYRPSVQVSEKPAWMNNLIVNK
jgi:carboxyl-terminal processing protease